MVYLEGYEIANFLVTNKEYLTFIAEGGYQNFQYWLDDGWAWVQQHEIIAPLYWVKKNNEWYQYALSGLQKVKPENILTHISFYEAQAFANWKGMRLPTEFEWEVASVQLNWGQRWEWTNSAYLPYPKYKAAEGAVGEYNGKFMINQMVLRGASIATAKGHERNTYRNFFAPYHQWQYTGIRLIK
jgi:ergothioneine biosynthesis protein EgtB